MLFFKYMYFIIKETLCIMNENQTRCCSFCQSPGHTIRRCQDPLIEEAWRYMICQVDIQNGLTLRPGDFDRLLVILNDYNESIICAVAVKYAHTLVNDTHIHHMNQICYYVNEEAKYFARLDGIQRDEYMRWLYPNEADDDDTDTDSWISTDEIPLLDLSIFDDEDEEEYAVIHPIRYHKIEPMILCLETIEELATITECNICYDEKRVFDMNTFQCQHSFCNGCVISLLKSVKAPTCPYCRQCVKTIEVKDMEHYESIQSFSC